MFHALHIRSFGPVLAACARRMIAALIVGSAAGIVLALAEAGRAYWFNPHS